MNNSKHLWPDPAPDVKWEVWSEDTFDREARPTKDTGGHGLLNGLTALWLRFLLETIRPEGSEGFTRFHLRRPSAPTVGVKGPIEGAARLRYWVFGKAKREIQDYLNVADRWLLELLITVHARLLEAENSSEPILELAAEAADQKRFEERLSEVAGSLDILLGQTDREDARKLAPLTYSDKSRAYTAKPAKKEVPTQKPKARAPKPSRRKTIDYRLIAAAAFLIAGLFLAFVSGRGFALSCGRIESTLLDCTLERTWLGVIVSSRKPLDGLWRARVGQVCDTDGCSMFPELDTETGSIRLDSGSSSKLQPNQEIVDSINAFLSDPAAQELDIGSDFRLSKMIVPTTLILGGIVFLFAWLLKLLRQ